MEASRKSCDWKNAAVAGLVTGGVMGLPVALRAGEPRLALMAAGLTAGGCVEKKIVSQLLRLLAACS